MMGRKMLCVALAVAMDFLCVPAWADAVRCVLVVPPGEKPWPDAQKRLTLVLKDVQWWYSCQMEAYGYGSKTFGLETDKKGNVVVHKVYLKDSIQPGQTTVPKAVTDAAYSVAGRPNAKRLYVIVYNGYYWNKKDQIDVTPMGRGAANRWAHFSGWHYFNVCPAGWEDATVVAKLPEKNNYFPALHTRVLKKSNEAKRNVADRTSSGHGAFLHEIGHAFGLHHPPKKGHIKGDVMSGDFWHARGSFLADVESVYSCLSSSDAAILDKNPLFEVRKVGPPSSKSDRKVGMRGVKKN